MTLELFSNLLQLLVASISAVWAILLTVRKKNVNYMLCAGSLTTFALGLLYWLTYQYLQAETPQFFYVADISWVTSFLFILALELHLIEEKIKGQRHFAMYIPVVLLIAITIFFCQWGDIVYNIIIMVIFSVCSYFAVANLLFGDKKYKNIHIFCLAFILIENLLWLASCFWISDTWTNPYFWFDFMLTFVMGAFLPIVRKAVEA